MKKEVFKGSTMYYLEAVVELFLDIVWDTVFMLAYSSLLISTRIVFLWQDLKMNLKCVYNEDHYSSSHFSPLKDMFRIVWETELKGQSLHSEKTLSWGLL